MGAGGAEVDVRRNFPRPGGWPVVAIDPRGSGRLFVVWGDYRRRPRIVCATSEDSGRTWTEPVRVNDDPRGNGKDQSMQWLAVDPTDGAAYVVFYDRRDDPDNVSATVTLARSTDGGRTFTNYAWSDTASGPEIRLPRRLSRHRRLRRARVRRLDRDAPAPGRRQAKSRKAGAGGNGRRRARLAVRTDGGPGRER